MAEEDTDYLKKHLKEAMKLNRLLQAELEETNRGVIALTIELEEKNDALQKLNNELHHRANELANTNEELEAFSYSVSHDLRARFEASTDSAILSLTSTRTYWTKRAGNAFSSSAPSATGWEN